MLLKRIAACLLVIALLTSSLPVFAAEEPVSALLALADEMTASDGAFRVSSSADLYYVSNSAPDGDLLSTLRLARQQLMQLDGITSCDLVFGTLSDAPDGSILLFEDASLSEEAYRLVIATDGVQIYFGKTEKCAWYDGDYSYNGLFYALSMLQKLVKVYSGVLPCVEISDCPDTPERTVMLDCARKYWSVAWIKNLIAQMSYLGYNALELHLAEDQGIRCNIWSDGSDCNGNDFSFLIGYDQNWNKSYPDPNAERSYSADDLREIAAFAKLYHVELIPDYDVPPHCDVLTKRYEDYVSKHPEFRFLYDGLRYTKDGTKTGDSVKAYPDGADFLKISLESTGSCVDVTNPVGRAFALAVVEAYADFFAKLGCTKFNLGCDELRVEDSDGWAEYAEKNIKGGSTAVDTLVDFINEADRMLNRHGYNDVRVFNDILYHGGKRVSNIALNEDVSVCVWSVDTPASVEAIAKENRPMFNCIQNYCYYVLRYNDEKNGGDARSPANTWWSFHHSTEEKIYREWSPQRMYNYDAKSPDIDTVRGGYFLIWGDFGGYRTESQVWNGESGTGAYNLVDRLWSNAVKQWAHNADERLSYENFSDLRVFLRLFPLYTDCSQPPAEPEKAAPVSMSRKISFAAQVGKKTVILGTDAVKDEASPTVDIPYLRGYVFRADGLLFTPGGKPGYAGSVQLDAQTQTLFYESRPDLSELRMLLADARQTDDAAYLSAYRTAQALYDYLCLETSEITQDVIDRAADALKQAAENLP